QRARNQHKSRANKIKGPFQRALPGRFRRRPEHHHWPAVEVIKARAGNLRLEEISHKPCLNAFQFARMDRSLDLLEVSVLGADDDSIDRVLMQQLNQLVDACVVEVGHRCDDDILFRMSFDFVFYPAGFLFRANQYEVARRLLTGELALEEESDQLL